MATPSKTTKAKKATTAKAQNTKTAKAKKSTKAKAKLDTKNTKDTVKQTVKSVRNIKYKYPEDIEGPVKRKSWRQMVRNQFKKLELAVAKAEDAKAEKEAKKALQEYREEVLLVP